VALLVAAAQRGAPQPDLDASDFTDPTARALLLHLHQVLASAPADWRPDLLAEAEDPWLAEGARRVRPVLDDVARLSDAQLAAELHSIRRQLRGARLAVELREQTLALQDAEDDVAERIKAGIAENARERFALQKEDTRDARGPTALGRRVPAVPARFRSSGER
jgi:hypothetical protein